MITSAMVILRHGRKTIGPMKFTDSHGLAVGDEYLINLDGRTLEWRIQKIVEVLEEACSQPSSSS